MKLNSLAFLVITQLAEAVWTLGALLVVLYLVPGVSIQGMTTVLGVAGLLWLSQQAITLGCLTVGWKLTMAVVINAAIAAVNRPVQQLSYRNLAYRLGVVGSRTVGYWGMLSLLGWLLPKVQISGWRAGWISAIALLVLTHSLADLFGKPLTSLLHHRWLTPLYLLANLGLWLLIPTSLWWVGSGLSHRFQIVSWVDAIMLMVVVSGLNDGISQGIQTSLHLISSPQTLKQQVAKHLSRLNLPPAVLLIGMVSLPLLWIAVYFYLADVISPGVTVQGLGGYGEIVVIWLLVSMPQTALSDHLDRQLKRCFGRVTTA